MAGASSAFAARSSGVVPIVSMPSRPRSLPMLRNGGGSFSCAFGIRAGVEQQLDDIAGGGLVERRPIGPAAARNRVHVNRRVERRRGPSRSHLFGFAPLLIRYAADIELHVDDGHAAAG